VNLRDELRALAREMLAEDKADPSWAGLEVPERLDGAGASFAETAVVVEELGRAAAGGAYLGTAVLGVGALQLATPDDAGEQLLRRIALGDVTTAVAFAADPDAAGPPQPPFRIERGRLFGQARFVPDAAVADQVLLIATDAGAPVLVAAPADLDVVPEPQLDETRALATVTADGLALDGARIWRFADPDAALGHLFDRAALALAADSLGVAAAMLADTVAYAKTRTQFDRPIGSFQAVKHACADLLVEQAVARELVDAAIDLVAAGRPAASAVSMAKARATEAAVAAAGKAMQLHGGFGYTWESGIHRYLKRASLNAALHGSPAEHRRRLAARYPRP
jgi:alkylation response protein AidB-like acyl-CoA dehydrogenase